MSGAAFWAGSFVVVAICYAMFCTWERGVAKQESQRTAGFRERVQVPISFTPILADERRLIIKAFLNLAVSDGVPEPEIRAEVESVAHSKISKWALNFTDPATLLNVKEYETLETILAEVSGKSYTVTRAAVELIVPLKPKVLPPLPFFEEMLGDAKTLHDIDSFEPRLQREYPDVYDNPKLMEVLRTKMKAKRHAILDPPVPSGI